MDLQNFRMSEDLSIQKLRQVHIDPVAELLIKCKIQAVATFCTCSLWLLWGALKQIFQKAKRRRSHILNGQKSRGRDMMVVNILWIHFIPYCQLIVPTHKRINKCSDVISNRSLSIPSSQPRSRCKASRSSCRPEGLWRTWCQQWYQLPLSRKQLRRL